uniref:Uncharacterized protein n=1 Tax=Rhizophora mucronata TaxID=61149 RepID=A0A2P2ITH8_RHIMU
MRRWARCCLSPGCRMLDSLLFQQARGGRTERKD